MATKGKRLKNRFPFERKPLTKRDVASLLRDFSQFGSAANLTAIKSESDVTLMRRFVSSFRVTFESASNALVWQTLQEMRHANKL